MNEPTFTDLEIEQGLLLWEMVHANEEIMGEMAAISAAFEQGGLDDEEGWQLLHAGAFGERVRE